jgi:succinyl-diaminopimelate desuccinylase
MNDITSTFEKIAADRERMVDLQKRLCSVPAMAPESGGDGEGLKADLLVAWLKDHRFLQIEVIDVPDPRVSSGKRPNIIVTLEGADAQNTLWIMTHLDVVPPGDLSLWHHPPFEAHVEEGKIFGRGVEDNQQSMVASIFAALSFLELDRPPGLTVKLLFIADEETGSEKGIKHLLAHRRLFRKNDLILVPDLGTDDSSMIEIAEKDILWLRFRTTGKQCHASTPQKGINAFVAGSELVSKLWQLNRTFDQRDELFDHPVSTFCPTKKEANIPNINTIPAEDIFYMDCRILPSVGLAAVRKEIDGMLREVEEKHSVTIGCEVIQKGESPPTPQDSAIVSALKQAIPQVYPVEPRAMGIGGGTVGAHIRSEGYAVAGWSTLDETAHMPNEYCRIDNMVGDAKVMAHMMMG